MFNNCLTCCNSWFAFRSSKYRWNSIVLVKLCYYCNYRHFRLFNDYLLLGEGRSAL